MHKVKEINRQPNIITMAEYSFGLIEQRIMYLIINQLDTGINIEQDLFHNKKFKIPIKLLGDTNFKRVKNAAKKLSEKQIVPVDTNERYEAIRPFPRVSVENGGFLEITMFADVLPLFLELKNGYTRYKLHTALSLKSTYSQRLYEMLSQFKDTGKWQKVSIEDLRRKLGITEGQYKNFGMFKKRVLERAQEEINNNTELLFSYNCHKTGKQYTHISFNIKFNPDIDIRNELNDIVSNDQESAQCLVLLQKIGITKPLLQLQIIKEKQLLFWKWMHKWRQTPTVDRKKIKNPAGKLLYDLGLVSNE